MMWYVDTFFNFQLSHESSLRPGLGHPSQQEELVGLCGKEEERHSNTLKTIHEHAHSVKVKYH